MNNLAAILAFLIVSVAGAKEKVCTYEFDVENSKVEGTGYKFTEKTGVTGQFGGVKLNKSEKKEKAEDLLNGLEVTVDLMTLDSGNALRDRNLRETLFAGILGDSVAKVSVTKVEKNKIEADLKINEKSQKITFDYKMDKETMTATGKFDAVKFALGDQMAALKKRCGSLHTGSDGKSVTWTEFALSVKAKLKKVCK